MNSDGRRSEWKEMSLADVAVWGSGGTPLRTNPAYFGGGIPWVVIGDLNEGIIDQSTETITEEGLRNSSAKWVEPGCVLVAMYGSIGKLGITGRRLTTNQAIAFAAPKDNLVSSKYLFWYLRRMRHDLIAAGKGGTQKNISQTVLKALPISVPPRSVQDRMVDEIEKQWTRVDAALASIHRLRSSLKGLMASIHQTAVKGGSDWANTTLGELIERGHGLFTDGDWIETKDQDPNGDVRLIQLADIGVAQFLNRSARFLTKERAVELGCTFLAPGDVLVARMPDPLGRACIFPGNPKESVTAVDVCIVRPGNNGVNSRWLVAALNSPLIRSEIAQFQSGSTRKRISRRNLARIPIPTPPPAEQNSLADEIDRGGTLARQLEAECSRALRRAESIRHGILAKGFAGELLGGGRASLG